MATGKLTTLHVVGAAILDRDRVLAAQRGAAMAAPLVWEFPGGKVEDGEDPRAALAREIREELGLEIAVGLPLGRGDCIDRGSVDGGRGDGGQADGGRRIVLDVYLATIIGGELVLHEHRAVRWLTAGELDDLPWAAPDVPILPLLGHHLRTRS